MFTERGDKSGLARWNGLAGVAAGVLFVLSTILNLLASHRSGVFGERCGRRADGGRLLLQCLRLETRGHYDVSGDTGKLSVEQGSSGEGVRLGGEVRNEWYLRFNDAVPTDLVVEMGAGESDLDLDSLALTGLDLEMGAAETTVDLTGDYAQGFDASIEGGVGEATVLLPSGVRVRSEGGLGKIKAEGFSREGSVYINHAYGDSEVTLDVEVRGGVGQINLEVV